VKTDPVAHGEARQALRRRRLERIDRCTRSVEAVDAVQLDVALGLGLGVKVRTPRGLAIAGRMVIT
jgi:hypothetical protein